MAISNQCLTIPPDHPLAKELYDLICAQLKCMRVFSPGTAEHAAYHGNAEKQDEYGKALHLIDAEILFLQAQYRAQRGGDESCTVGLTYGPNGFAKVDGRPPDTTSTIEAWVMQKLEAGEVA